MATNAQYTAQPILECFQCSLTGDTSRSAPTNTATLCAGPATAAAAGVGKRILRVIVQEVNAAGAGTANVIRFWLANPSTGTKTLYAERAVPSITSSGTAVGFRAEMTELAGLLLPGATSNAATLYISAHTTATFHVIVESGLL